MNEKKMDGECQKGPSIMKKHEIGSRECCHSVTFPETDMTSERDLGLGRVWPYWDEVFGLTGKGKGPEASHVHEPMVQWAVRTAWTFTLAVLGSMGDLEQRRNWV